ncbi:MAG: hypothetical protein ACJ76S_03625 [Solirubrobacteraceae bacterium]
MPFGKLAWLTTVIVCVIAAALLLIFGYDGYGATVFVVALSAAINLR